mmetsp:Transcript_37352/g.90120  ORF Transcript_37352/g.90120 Transcript_37352/m.90120 type:complete len:460 (+) Transcript_37352:64-1443(+)
MMSRANCIIIGAAFLSGLALASAKGVHHEVGGSDDGNLRRKRHLKETGKLVTKRRRKKGDDNILMDDEDLAFWTRLLGKEMEIGSVPVVPRPPTPTVNTPRPISTPVRPPVRPPTGNTPNPVSPIQTPAPVESTPEPTYSPIKPETLSPTNKCGLTASERRSQILDILGAISFSDLFETTGTPQQQALDWIVDDDVSQLCPDDSSLIQRYTLALFYYSTNGDDWKQCNAPEEFDDASIDEANAACTLTTVNATTIFPNDQRGTNAWLTSGSECLWGGISCYAPNTPNARMVNVVEFENNGLSGTLPAEMEELVKMRFFALERGSITGPIPSSYGNLKSLLLLDFDFNNLDGTLPESLWTLTSLRQLDLNDNNFVGELSDEIGQLRQLRFFQIDNNMMEGVIPTALGDIPNFSLIGLSGNNFEGAMPSKVCDLRPNPLQTLVVDCDIDCDIPDCCTSCAP